MKLILSIGSISPYHNHGRSQHGDSGNWTVSLRVARLCHQSISLEASRIITFHSYELKGLSGRELCYTHKNVARVLRYTLCLKQASMKDLHCANIRV